VSKWSELKTLDNSGLSDQLRVLKLVHKKAGFTVTQKNRESYVVRATLQGLLGADANDLKTGDPGTDPEGVRRSAAEAGWE